MLCKVFHMHVVRGFMWITIGLRKWISMSWDQISVGCWHWNSFLLANQHAGDRQFSICFLCASLSLPESWLWAWDQVFIWSKEYQHWICRWKRWIWGFSNPQRMHASCPTQIHIFCSIFAGFTAVGFTVFTLVASWNLRISHAPSLRNEFCVGAQHAIFELEGSGGNPGTKKKKYHPKKRVLKYLRGRSRIYVEFFMGAVRSEVPGWSCGCQLFDGWWVVNRVINLIYLFTRPFIGGINSIYKWCLASVWGAFFHFNGDTNSVALGAPLRRSPQWALGGPWFKLAVVSSEWSCLGASWYWWYMSNEKTWLLRVFGGIILPTSMGIIS